MSRALHLTLSQLADAIAAARADVARGSKYAPERLRRLVALAPPPPMSLRDTIRAIEKGRRTPFATIRKP